MTVAFMEPALTDYQRWAVFDKKIFERINEIIKDISRNHYKGIGKPEPLKHNLKGWWSRRITEEHRLVYKIENQMVFILSCRFHYQ